MSRFESVVVSSGPNRLDALQLSPDVLKRLKGLDLSRRIGDIEQCIGVGASADVCRGWLSNTMPGGPREKVAVKCMRIHANPDIKLVSA